MSGMLRHMLTSRRSPIHTNLKTVYRGKVNVRLFRLQSEHLCISVFDQRVYALVSLVKNELIWQKNDLHFIIYAFFHK